MDACKQSTEEPDVSTLDLVQTIRTPEARKLLADFLNTSPEPMAMSQEIERLLATPEGVATLRDIMEKRLQQHVPADTSDEWQYQAAAIATQRVHSEVWSALYHILM